MLKAVSGLILVQVARERNVRLLSRRGGGPVPASMAACMAATMARRSGRLIA
jgi:hypothetical protein